MAYAADWVERKACCNPVCLGGQLKPKSVVPLSWDLKIVNQEDSAALNGLQNHA